MAIIINVMLIECTSWTREAFLRTVYKIRRLDFNSFSSLANAWSDEEEMVFPKGSINCAVS